MCFPTPLLLPINAAPTNHAFDFQARTHDCLPNLQVRKMKRRNCEYDYVEVMACPSGCLNGGGQLKAGEGQSQQQLLDQLDAIYHDPKVCSLPVFLLWCLTSGVQRASSRRLLSWMPQTSMPRCDMFLLSIVQFLHGTNTSKGIFLVSFRGPTRNFAFSCHII